MPTLSNIDILAVFAGLVEVVEELVGYTNLTLPSEGIGSGALARVILHKYRQQKTES